MRERVCLYIHISYFYVCLRLSLGLLLSSDLYQGHVAVAYRSLPFWPSLKTLSLSRDTYTSVSGDDTVSIDDDTTVGVMRRRMLALNHGRIMSLNREGSVSDAYQGMH